MSVGRRIGIVRRARTVAGGLLWVTFGNLLLVGAAARLLSSEDFATVALWLSFLMALQTTIGGPLEASAARYRMGNYFPFRIVSLAAASSAFLLVSTIVGAILRQSSLYGPAFSSSPTLLALFFVYIYITGVSSVTRGLFIGDGQFGFVATQHAVDGTIRALGALLLILGFSLVPESAVSVVGILVLSSGFAAIVSVLNVRQLRVKRRASPTVARPRRSGSFGNQAVASVSLVVLVHGLLPTAALISAASAAEISQTYATLLLVRMAAVGAAAFHGPVMLYSHELATRTNDVRQRTLVSILRRYAAHLFAFSLLTLLAVMLSFAFVPRLIGLIFGSALMPSSGLAVLYLIGGVGTFGYGVLVSAAWGFGMYRASALAAGWGAIALAGPVFLPQPSLGVRVGVAIVLWTFCGSVVLVRSLLKGPSANPASR